MHLHRVFPHVANTAIGEPGHALHVPVPQGAGRVDNPARYEVLYVSSAAAGAVAEAFGNLSVWTPRMFEVPAPRGGRRALAAFALPDDAPILDLDDPAALASLGLRPSDIVTRDRQVTQGWSLRAFERHEWIGLRWWSYYDARWYSYGLWDRRRLRLDNVETLSLEHPAVVEAAEVLRRPRRGH